MAFAQTITRQQRRRLARTLRDPVEFSRAWLRQQLWAKQVEILRAIAIPHARVAVKGCHKSGKTHDAANAVLWWLIQDPQAIVVTTAASMTSVRKQLWVRIGEAAAGSRIAFPAPLETELRLGRENWALGLSTNKAERFQGFSGRKVFVVIDESPGVQAAIWEAIEGIRAGGDVRLLALGNPTVPGGPFYDAFNKDRGSWTTITISAFDTPNVRPHLELFNHQPGALTDAELVAFLEALPEEDLDAMPWPGLTSPRWVLEKWHEWGKAKNPLWDSRVMGRFPRQGAHSLIWLAWLEAAQHRELTPSPTDALAAGIDVAGPGKAETVLYVRRGPTQVALQSWTDPEPEGLVVRALAPYPEFRSGGPGVIRVDSAGIGYYFMLHLRELGFNAIGVNVGDPAHDPTRFVNLKAELYWGLRERFEAGTVAGVVDETTIAQLATLQYRVTARGLIAMETKEELAARGVASPDRAEALMLSYAPATMAGALELI